MTTEPQTPDRIGQVALRRALGVGLAWAILWLACWAIIFATIAMVDPDIIDPGEGPIAVAVFGSMGFFTGLVFGMLMSIGRRARFPSGLPFAQVAGRGVLATAVVQLAYLGHGDQGLVANLGVAALFTAIGGFVTCSWFIVARRRFAPRWSPPAIP